MNILGISAFYHDSASCLVQDGRVVAAAQEERFSRVKHDPRFPRNAAAYCLSQGGIDATDLDYVVFYDKPLLTFERLLFTYLSIAPAGLRSWVAAMPRWLGRKLHVPRIVRKELGYRKDVLFTEHHEAHAACAFYQSPFDSSAILTVDGVGEWATASWGEGERNEFRLAEELRFPNSLGLLYSAFTYFCGFRVNSGEYKLMGLAPYGVPRYAEIILDEIVDLKEDGSVGLNLAYFDFLGGNTMTNHRFSALFGGKPRAPESPITTREMDLAASIQRVAEQALLNMANYVRRRTGRDSLCMAGGVALNCVANGRILRESNFKRLWIQPAAGDAGGALGAALAVWHRYLGNPRNPAFSCDSDHGTYLGPWYSDEKIGEFLSRDGYPGHRTSAAEIAAAIASGSIVGYLNGRMEFGPRALGGRSILADPRDAETQTRLNLKIKYRESFRPFAPSVLADKAADYFDLKGSSPYMLLVAHVNEEHRMAVKEIRQDDMPARLKQKRSTLPAVTHLDYSARLHTVTPKAHEPYHQLLSEFYRLTGCPVLVNTSFNVRGEPIVCSPEDAYRCFMRTEMDALVLGNVLLRKEEQPPWAELPRKEADHATSEKADARRFGLVGGTILAALCGLNLYHGRVVLPPVFGVLAVAAWLIALLPGPLAPLYRAWVMVGRGIGIACTALMMTLAFYTVLVPFALVVRIVRGSLLGKTFDRTAATYWSKREDELQPLGRYTRRF